MKLFDSPRVTLISRPEFLYPAHIDWTSDSDNDADVLPEFSGRLCYLSWGSGELDGHKTIRGRSTNQSYLENIIRTGHHSVLEHANFSILIEGVSRALTHELVRHRAGTSYSQLSQRYVDESNVSFVIPPELLQYKDLAVEEGEETPYTLFVQSCEESLFKYREMLSILERDLAESDEPRTNRLKRARQAARAVLPNSTETKIVVTGNVRAWRHFLEMRAAPGADLEIRRLAMEIYRVLYNESPTLFGDYEVVPMADGFPVLDTHYYSDVDY